MPGTLVFYLVPVKNMEAARPFYRDVLGLEESWREGESTTGFKLPGSDVELMVDEVAGVEFDAAGPVFLIESVDEFYALNKEQIIFVGEPGETPDGKIVAARDDSGNGIYFTDQSKS
ncbi:VOC family protein [Paenibacillaceae bacterium]|nr:VOC family protein [Paenibacillaceae bacterium]